MHLRKLLAQTNRVPAEINSHSLRISSKRTAGGVLSRLRMFEIGEHRLLIKNPALEVDKLNLA
jgi:hypothetical protein